MNAVGAFSACCYKLKSPRDILFGLCNMSVKSYHRIINSRVDVAFSDKHLTWQEHNIDIFLIKPRHHSH